MVSQEQGVRSGPCWVCAPSVASAGCRPVGQSLAADQAWLFVVAWMQFSSQAIAAHAVSNGVISKKAFLHDECFMAFILYIIHDYLPFLPGTNTDLEFQCKIKSRKVPVDKHSLLLLPTCRPWVSVSLLPRGTWACLAIELMGGSR